MAWLQLALAFGATAILKGHEDFLAMIKSTTPGAFHHLMANIYDQVL